MILFLLPFQLLIECHGFSIWLNNCGHDLGAILWPCLRKSCVRRRGKEPSAAGSPVESRSLTPVSMFYYSFLARRVCGPSSHDCFNQTAVSGVCWSRSPNCPDCRFMRIFDASGGTSYSRTAALSEHSAWPICQDLWVDSVFLVEVSFLVFAFFKPRRVVMSEQKFWEALGSARISKLFHLRYSGSRKHTAKLL